MSTNASLDAGRFRGVATIDESGDRAASRIYGKRERTGAARATAKEPFTNRRISRPRTL